MKKNKNQLFILYVITIIALINWLSYLESAWFEEYYTVSVDYLRSEIYSLEHFYITLVIILVACIFLRHRVIGLFIATLPIMNVPVPSSGIGVLYQGGVTLFFLVIIIKIIRWKILLQLRISPALVLMIYLIIHSGLTLIIRYDSSNSLHILILARLAMILICIFCIILISEENLSRVINSRDIEIGLLYQMVTLVIFFIMMIILFFTGDGFIPTPYALNSTFSIDRLTLGFNHPNELALFLVGIFPYLYVRTKLYSKFLGLFFWVLFFLCSILTLSRALIVALIIVSIIFLIRKKLSLLLVMGYVGIIFSSFLIFVNLRTEDFYSIESRGEDYESAIQTFILSPLKILFGNGFGISGYGFPQPHNLILDMIYNIGLLGFALYLLFLVDLLRRLAKGRSAGFYSIIGVLAYGLFHSLWMTWLFYYFLAFALINLYCNKKSSNIINNALT